MPGIRTSDKMTSGRNSNSVSATKCARGKARDASSGSNKARKVASSSIRSSDNAGVDTTSIGMRWPHAVVVHDGKVLVADAGNNRIMAWNAQPNADGAMASFVLGQTSFEANSHNRGGYHPNERSLQMPYGLAVLDGGLICADTANSRLVGYELDNIDMDRSAVRLSGQHGFQKKGDNRWRFATRDSLCWPFALAVQGQLVAVADTGNNRVMFWEKA